MKTKYLLVLKGTQPYLKIDRDKYDKLTPVEKNNLDFEMILEDMDATQAHSGWKPLDKWVKKGIVKRLHS